MTVHASVHVYSTEAVETMDYEGRDWLRAGDVSVFVDDADTAERVARGFMELAEKMRERRGLPDSQFGNNDSAEMPVMQLREIEVLPF